MSISLLTVFVALQFRDAYSAQQSDWWQRSSFERQQYSLMLSCLCQLLLSATIMFSRWSSSMDFVCCLHVRYRYRNLRLPLLQVCKVRHNDRSTSTKINHRLTGGLDQASAVMYSMRSREYDVAGAASTPPPSVPSPIEHTERSGVNSPSVFTSKHISVKAGKKTYISRILGGEVFLLCTR